MSTNLQNSIWPNAGVTLGQNKVQIPDGVTTPWPTGDALVHNFVFNEGKLVGLVDTKALIANSSKTTTFPYDYVNISLPSIAEGEMTYNHDQCTYFILNGKVIKGDVPTDEELEEINYKYMGCTTVNEIKAVDPNYLTNDIIDGVWSEWLGDLDNGKYMFYDCKNLTTFNANLSSLTDGKDMFGYCDNLTSFNSDLSSLTNGEGMFNHCDALTSFNSDLSSLTNSYAMFASCYELTTFYSDLPSLTDGDNMFYDCDNLTSFNSDLSSLTSGSWMFAGCSLLESFFSDLSSLTDGYGMFSYCSLNTASVQHIADTINTCNGIINIGIGNNTPNTEETAAFNTIASKGWTVYVIVNGGNESQWTPTSLIPIDGEETVTPIPFWAKPTPSDEKHALYVDSEGNFYNILGGNYIYGDNLETYGMFTCEEDAAANMRLTKIEK